MGIASLLTTAKTIQYYQLLDLDPDTVTYSLTLSHNGAYGKAIKGPNMTITSAVPYATLNYFVYLAYLFFQQAELVAYF